MYSGKLYLSSLVLIDFGKNIQEKSLVYNLEPSTAVRTLHQVCHWQKYSGLLKSFVTVAALGKLILRDTTRF